MFTLEERTMEWERRHPRYAKRATPENEARYAAMCERVAELAQLAEESANVELEAFGCVEFEPQFNWGAKSTPEERGWSRAVLDIIAFEGAADAESLFELF